MSGPHDDGGVHLPIIGIANEVFAWLIEDDGERLARIVGPTILFGRAKIERVVAAQAPDERLCLSVVGNNQPVAFIHEHGVGGKFSVLNRKQLISCLRNASALTQS